MDRLWIALTDRIEIRSRDEETWRSDSVQVGEQIECLAAHDARPDRVFCGTFGAGIKRSLDGGRSFERVGKTEIDYDAVTSVAVDPSDPDVLLAGTEPSAIFRSTDGGDTWERMHGTTDVPSSQEWSFPPRPHTHHIRWIEIAPEDPDRWYVGIEAGAFLLTKDGGDSWIDRPTGSRRDNHTIATHPDEPNRVYVAAGDGYAESDDGGRNWSLPQEGLPHRYVWGLAVDVGDSDTRYVSAARDASRAHRMPGAEAYVYRRRGDRHWEAVDGLPTGDGVLRPLLATGGTPGTVYAASNEGIHVSYDTGQEWERIPGAWPDRYAEHPPRGITAVAD